MKTAIKYTILFVSAILALASCKKQEQKANLSELIIGNWTLETIEMKSPSIGSTTVEVTLAFNPDNSFLIFQKIGEGRSKTFTGVYAIDGDKLSGTYTDGSKWGDTYTAEISSDILKLTTSNGKETDTYKRK